MPRIIINCACGLRIEKKSANKIICRKCYRIYTRKYVGKGRYEWQINGSNIKDKS